MKHLITLLLCIFAACSFAFAQSADEQAILKLEDRLRTARLNNGVAELEQLTDPDLQLVNQRSSRNNRATFLTSSKTFKPSEITHSAVKVSIVGDTAIVSGDKREITPNTMGRPQFLHFMHTWVKRAEGWKLLALQQQFDVREGTVTPAGWLGQSSVEHLIGRDTEVKRSGAASLFLKSKFAEDRIVGTGIGDTGIGQAIKADAYRGKRILLTGYTKGRVEYGLAYPWLRVNAEHNEGELLSFDNRLNEGFFIRSDWNQFSIVLDVPEQAAVINFGFVLSGRGHVWLDDWELAVVEKSVPTTNQVMTEAIQKKIEAARNNPNWLKEVEGYKKALLTLPTAATNLDFETAGKP